MSHFRSKFQLLTWLVSHFCVCLSFFYSILTHGAVQVTQLPTEDKVVELKDFTEFLLRSKIDSIIEDARKKEEDRESYFVDRVYAVSPEEARQNFSEYVSQFLTSEELEEGFLDIIFSDLYFGELSKLKRNSIQKNPFKICSEDPYVFGHIRNAWTLAVFCPGREGTMKNAKKKWSLGVQLLEPKQVFEVFKKSKMGYLLEGLEFESEDERIKTIFNYEHFGVPSEELARKAHFLENDLAFFSHELIQNVYENALMIMRQSAQGDTLVIFGNSPYFIGRALSHLIAEDAEQPNYRHIIEFPFSDTPNRIRGGNNFADLRDILTRERLDHFRERMYRAGLTHLNQQLSTHATYFIDVVASGGGIAFTMDQILRDFQSNGLELPNLNVISLNKIDIHHKKDSRNSMIALENPDQNGHTTLYFPKLHKPHFLVDCYEIYLPGHAHLDFINSDDHRGFPQYNSFYWQKQYDFLLTQSDPNFETILEYFDTNIRFLLETRGTEDISSHEALKSIK